MHRYEKRMIEPRILIIEDDEDLALEILSSFGMDRLDSDVRTR